MLTIGMQRLWWWPGLPPLPISKLLATSALSSSVAPSAVRHLVELARRCPAARLRTAAAPRRRSRRGCPGSSWRVRVGVVPRVLRLGAEGVAGRAAHVDAADAGGERRDDDVVPQLLALHLRRRLAVEAGGPLERRACRCVGRAKLLVTGAVACTLTSHLRQQVQVVGQARAAVGRAGGVGQHQVGVFLHAVDQHDLLGHGAEPPPVDVPALNRRSNSLTLLSAVCRGLRRCRRRCATARPGCARSPAAARRSGRSSSTPAMHLVDGRVGVARRPAGRRGCGRRRARSPAR